MRDVLFILALIILVACSGRDKLPSNILDQPKMTSVISDMLIADAIANERKTKDSIINLNSLSAYYYQGVFAMHRITKDDFFRSYNYYLNHPDLLKVVLDSAYMNTSKKVMPSYPKPDKKIK